MRPTTPLSGDDRPRRRRSPPPAGEPSGHLERSLSWAGLRAGDAVRVEGVRHRSARWTFVAHVRNTRSGDEWVEVAGGRPGNHALRSFKPEQIYPTGAGKVGKANRTIDAPSLAEAPRLPF